MASIMSKPGADPVELVGVGVVTADGIPLERAAERMHELQEIAEDGSRKPLEGDALLDAAEKWAARAGFDIDTTDAPYVPPAIADAPELTAPVVDEGAPVLTDVAPGPFAGAESVVPEPSGPVDLSTAPPAQEPA